MWSKTWTSIVALVAVLGVFPGQSIMAQVAKGGSPKVEASPAATIACFAIGPGESATNCDVTVDNELPENSDALGGSATIDPPKVFAGECDSTDSKVKTTGNFEGSIGGIEDGDIVQLGYSNDVEVTGDGGVVKVSGNSDVTVKCNAGGTGITVKSGGTTIVVPPGSSVTVST